MKSVLLFSLILSLTFLARGQKILTIDLDQIKQKITDKASYSYYPSLIGRFAKGDTLTDEELRCVYYGATLDTKEKAADKNTHDPGPEFRKYMDKGEFAKAVTLGLKILDKEPADIQTSYLMLICYDRLGNDDSARLFARRYYGLIRAIMSSGDGISAQTAMVVNQVADEYAILREAKFESKEQMLLMEEAGSTDKLVLDTESQTQEPKVSALYFNVEISFMAMRKMLEGNPALQDMLKKEK